MPKRANVVLLAFAWYSADLRLAKMAGVLGWVIDKRAGMVYYRDSSFFVLVWCMCRAQQKRMMPSVG